MTNLITVKTRPAPMELEQEIETALPRTAELDARNLAVDVRAPR